MLILLMRMDEFEQSDLEKETNDSYNTFYQSANAFIKNLSEAYFILSLVQNYDGSFQ